MLSRMLLFVVLIIVSFTLTAGQKSWKVRKADCLGSDKLPGVLLAGYFFDENRGWVVGETGELRSRSVRVGLSEGLSRCDVSVGSDLSAFDDVAFGGDNLGWIVGNVTDRYGKPRAVLLETENGGVSWTETGLGSLFTDFDEETDFDAVEYAGSGLYVLATKRIGGGDRFTGLILRGDLTGKRWEVVHRAVPGVFFQDVAFDKTGKYGWAITNQGTIHKSRDRGRTWAEQSFKLSDSLSRLFVIDSSNVWATSQSSLLIHTVDGGRNWKTVQVDVAQEIRKKYAVWFSGILFRGEKDGWIGGSGGLIMRTSDGGASWRMDSYGLSSFIYEIRLAGKNVVAIGKSEILVLESR